MPQTETPPPGPQPRPAPDFQIDTEAVAFAFRDFCDAKYRSDPDFRARFDAELADVRARRAKGAL